MLKVFPPFSLSPHYYDWMRRTQGAVPRNPGDVPCGGLPGVNDLDRALRAHGATPEQARTLRELHRVLRHVTVLDLPRLRNEARAGPQQNADLRLQYLLNQLDQEAWRKKLQQREKRRERAFAVMQVYDMFTAVASDMFRDLVAQRAEPAACVGELRQLQTFANDSLDGIARRFNMRVKRLRP